ncbi:MAG TPA: YigZ family protein [Bacteroidales bacterium]|jgi:uncharacterized YigZ family protein|nr:YigZ family protein [Bacteroidales bacterium]MDY0160276.1 YigZ family protein [Bacteroidales bacterium]HRW20473.1 YigZ family protein [Bacteroidales bacterium]HXK82149.1 YigZ family protein [Bacteroidales bacterium]
MCDKFKTIAYKSKGEFKEKGSKFYAFAFPVSNEEEVKEYQSALRKEYYDARHHVYAFIIGADSSFYRASDDGEPANSSGMPVLGQIRSHELTNILIVVIRYFGGVKLGIPGLINAYKTAAAQAIANNKIIEKVVRKIMQLSFEYSELNNVMRIASENQLQQINQHYDTACKIDFLVDKSDVEKLVSCFDLISNIKIEIIDE